MAEATSKRRPDYAEIFSLIVEFLLFYIKITYTMVYSIIKAVLPKTEKNVSGEFAFITGTGHGMGKEMAMQYAALGAKIICVDVNEKNNLKTVKDIKQAGGTAHGYTCDVTDREAVIALIAQIKQEHGFIDIVVNNAGIMPCHPLLEHTEKEIRLLFDLNVLSHFWILQAFLPDMLERNKGHIVCLSSCAGLFGLPNLVPYCGTKYAVRGIMQSLQEELRRLHPHNQIKFTTIYPYMVDTGLCKNPRIRFPWMKMLNPKEAAASIILAQRTNLEEASIPRYYSVLEKVGRLLPRQSMRVFVDFTDAYVDSDKLTN